MNGEKREKKSSGKGKKKEREKGTKNEITKHIASHANGGAPHIHFFPVL